MRRMLKMSTALAASLSLVAPVPGLAQEGLTEEQRAACEDAPAGGGGQEPLVLNVNGEDVTCPAGEEGGLGGAGAAAAEAEAEAEQPAEGAAPDAVSAEGEQPAGEAEAAAEATADAEQPEEAAAPDAVSVEGEQPAAEAEAEAEAEAPAAAEQPAAAAEAQPAEAEPAAGDDAAALEEALRRAQGEGGLGAAGAGAAAAEATAEGDDAEAEAVEEALREQAGGETEEAQEAATEAVEAAEQSEPEDTATGEAVQAEGGLAGAAADAAAAEAAAGAATDALMDNAYSADEEERGADGEVAEEAPAPEDTVDQSVSSAAALAADAEGEVTNETVTQETSRSSDEDFSTELSTTAAAAAEEDDDDDDGLSDLQKALIVGAGALAVGALLRGNREVVATSGDRAVVETDDGRYQLIKDDDALLRQPGAEVQTETFSDGSTRTTVTRDDGSRIVTIRDAELRVLRRTKILADGTQIALIDDTAEVQPVDVTQLPALQTQPSFAATDEAALRRALSAENTVDRRFSLYQVRDIREVRQLAPAIDVATVTFASGSAAITPDQARELSVLGRTIAELVEEDPREVFLVEGHTDAVGDAPMNLALSDRRAESLALALSEYFDVPPENLVVQGYGERFLKVPTQVAERENRRVVVRRITPLLQTAAAN